MTTRRTFIEPAITTADGARLEEFYSEGLGFTLAETLRLPHGTVHRLTRDDAVLKLFEPAGGPGERMVGMTWVGWAFATLHVTDVRGEVDRVTASGGRVVQPAQEFSPGNWFALVEDPDGNGWELISGANPISVA